MNATGYRKLPISAFQAGNVGRSMAQLTCELLTHMTRLLRLLSPTMGQGKADSLPQETRVSCGLDV